MYDITFPTLEPRQGCIYYYCVYNISIKGCEYHDVMYIGQTINPVRRHSDHLTNKSSRCPVDKLLRTHIFTYGVLWVGDENDLDDMERKYIEIFQTQFPFGFNFESGGRSGANIKNVSEETKRKKYNSPKNRAINQYDCNGRFLKTWPSVRGAVRSLGLKSGASGPICHVATGNGKYKSAYGYIWRYYDEYKDCIDLTGFIKKYQHYNEEGVLIKEYSSLEEASKDTGIKISSLKQYCGGGISSNKKWKTIYV